MVEDSLVWYQLAAGIIFDLRRDKTFCALQKLVVRTIDLYFFGWGLTECVFIAKAREAMFNVGK